MTRRPSIDWESAFAFFFGLGPVRSYVKVAHKFGVSEAAVRKQARLQDWEQRARDLDSKTRKAVEAEVVRDRVVRLRETVKIVELTRQELLDQLRAGKADVKLADLPALVKLEMLIEGDPTDRIEYSDVTQVLRAWVAIAARYVDPGKRQAFLAEVNAFLEGLDGSATRALPRGAE